MNEGMAMTEISTDHGSIAVSRVLKVEVSRAYAAFADPRERVQWGAPSEGVVGVIQMMCGL